ncbi:hypothetical protein RB199_36970 [Streptomyces libani]|uniref:Uncharacterized protein n=2 Tax=Streptomyces nigrescens TaxID=1920 RepID=A0A640TIC1_STRNI|nr:MULTISPECIES: hypothetical protein [Streptomyces]MCW7986447.1 hypothetical protein [Streptomyces platensis subsp. clarensis]AWN28967.1 hypothetical protein DKG71_25080 [Streptomyces sp. NEAU-S7GS2]MCX5451475.1 hypothetical protein [Streptomyces libani]MYT11627.1 hypothetical protein [Streptomyces sp. SID4951]WAT97251.1 hypothetical protein STRLI_003166 [Streptomyces libani subsp. libani]
MTFNPRDLPYEVLARTHHSHHYHSGDSSYGAGDGVLDWWEWLILVVGAVAVIWALVRKFSSD